MIAASPVVICRRCGKNFEWKSAGTVGRFCSAACSNALPEVSNADAWWSRLPHRYRRFEESQLPRPTLTARVLSWIDDWERAPSGDGLYLYGKSGLGKTRSALLLCRRILEWDDTVSLEWVNMREFSDEVVNRTKPSGPGGLREYVQPLHDADYLLIDDLSKGWFAPGPKRELYGLIDHRMHNDLPTFYTSEVGLTQVKALLKDEGDGIARRIQESTTAIKFT
jgi:DNA replication protein DnaC